MAKSPVHIYILVGASNAQGLQAPYVSHPADQQVLFWPEVGIVADTEPDIITGEYPPGSPATEARWNQLVDRAPLDLGPFPLPTGPTVWGPAVHIGRFAHEDLAAQGTGGRVGVALFAYAKSSLNRHWMNDRPMDLCERMLMHLAAIREQLLASGHCIIWESLTVSHGEGDSVHEDDAKAHGPWLRKVIGKVRGFTGNPNLPVVIVQTDIKIDLLSPAVRAKRRTLFETVRDAQAEVAREDATTIALTPTSDCIHMDPWHFRFDQYEIIYRRAFDDGRRLRQNGTARKR